MFLFKVEFDDPIVMIQIFKSKRLAFVNELKKMEPHQDFLLKAKTGEDVIFRRTDQFVIDVSQRNKLVLNLTDEEWVNIIEAAQRHIEQVPEHLKSLRKGNFPLDHSLESRRAKFIPEEITDVVIETIEG